MKINRRFLCVYFLLGSCLCLADNQAQNLDTELLRFLKNHADELAAKGFRSEYTIGNIDPRLTIKQCANPLSLSFNKEPIKQNNTTVLVECDDKQPWKLFISVTYNIYSQAVVANQPISRGTSIDASMLALKDQIINQNHYPYYSNPTELQGMRAKRTIRSGATITPDQLQTPSLISKGDSVIIIAANDVISVRMKGIALSDGVQGEQISIRNSQTERIVKARVIDNNRVLIAL